MQFGQRLNSDEKRGTLVCLFYCVCTFSSHCHMQHSTPIWGNDLQHIAEILFRSDWPRIQIELKVHFYNLAFGDSN